MCRARPCGAWSASEGFPTFGWGRAIGSTLVRCSGICGGLVWLARGRLRFVMRSPLGALHILEGLMARRNKGVPGLKLLPDGRWRLRATVKDPRTQKMLEQQRTLDTGYSQGQALLVLEEIRAELRAGLAPPRHEALTLTDFAVGWLAEGRGARVSERTRQTYESALTTRILPRLGHLEVDDITRNDVDRWCRWAETVRTQRGGTYADPTVKKWWRCLRTLVRDMAAEYDRPDPTVRVSPPQRPKTHGTWHHETRALRWDQVGRVLAHVGDHRPFYHPALCLLAWTGARVSEVRQLRWEHVDLDAGVVTIHTTKTGGVRDVPMSDELVTVLRAHRERLIRDQHLGLSTGLVVPAACGKALSIGRLRTILVKTRRALGIEQRVTPHVLRRSFNTALRRAGIDRIVQRSMVGHTSEAMTELYDGTDMADKRAAIEAIMAFDGV